MNSDLEQLKSILLGKEYAELIELKNEFENSEAFTDAVAAVIAEALASRGEKDDRVAEVLAPAIDRAISGSIDQDPKKLAESLYPIMGPAIRKSISETLQQMLENFNQLLEQSLSPKSLGWRFDAWRTGRSYSELVLLNTLEYQIEQVFLIHQETSLLMQHVFSDFAEKKDPDMVSSMFSAIQDFIEDSFSVAEGDVLDSLRLGDLSVVIQRGPLAVIAAVVRGNPPDHLRESLQKTSESIHQKKRAALQDYSGDPDDFVDIEADLRTILEFKQKQEDKTRSIPWLAIAAISVITIIAGYFTYQDHQHQLLRQQISQQLDAEPGLVVLSDNYSDGVHTVTALLDPLAEDVTNLLTPNNPDIAATQLITYPYLSADDAIILKRVAQLIEPPSGVDASVIEGRLTLSGAATVQWYEQISGLTAAIPGVRAVDTSQLFLSDPVAERLEALKNTVESFIYTFDKEVIQLESNEEIETIASAIMAIGREQNQIGGPAKFDVVGYTDNTGSTGFNRRIGLSRAENLMELLISNGVPAEQLEPYNSFDYHQTDVPASREVRIFMSVQSE